MKKMALVLAAFAGIGVTASMAATDGVVGHYSEGDFDITLSIAPKVLIKGLEDLELKYTGDSKASGTANFCVYSSASNNQYKIKATATYTDDKGPQNGFGLGDGTANYMLYLVLFDDNDENTGRLGLASDMFTTNPIVGSNDEACGTDNASIFIETLNTVDTFAVSTYTGKMTLTVEPS